MWALRRALKTAEERIPSSAIVREYRRGRDPEFAKPLEERLAMIRRREEPMQAPPTDIGLAHPKASRSKQLAERLQLLKEHKKNVEIERLAHSHELSIDVENVQKDWLNFNGPYHIRTIAKHYGVYKDLYEEGFFVPRVPMQILFSFDEKSQSPVYYGNIIKPHEATEAPEVSFEADDNTLWTLMLTNLDGHLTKENHEYVHWCIANIPGNKVQDGETLVEYLQPIPPKGTGYHRYVFVLYKQEKRIDYDLKKVSANDPLESRTFLTRPWYKKYEDLITPAGLAFFQSDWDSTLTGFYHNTLNMKEPIFEYDYDPPYIVKQERFPKKKPFNLYLDKYRNPKDVLKDYLLIKLKKEHPFKKPEPPLKHPNAHFIPQGLPSWYVFEQKKNRNKWGRINDV